MGRRHLQISIGARWSGTTLLAGAITSAAGPLAAQTAKVFPPPGRTTWTPVGCRVPDVEQPVLASRAAWRSLHSDEVNTDEVSIAYAPVFEADWLAEPLTWNPTGPVFDDVGNLYFVPFQPHEPVALVSLRAADGSRRWSIPNTTGAPAGAGTPLVLDDPDAAGDDVVYVGLYDRAFAVRPDGSVVWDAPTGLTGTPVVVFGVNYHAGADAIVGLAQDGFIYALDWRTGAPVLNAPYQLPGAPAPPGPPLVVPAAVQACAESELALLADLGGTSIATVIDILLGNRVEVANYFSIDPVAGRLWVAATAADAEDGVVDGVSQLGALYGLDLVPNGGGYDVVEACHRPFVGGSASTPALPRDGSRVYVGDNVGNLLAIDTSCNDIWTLPVGGQITGSVGVAADNREVYASTMTSIHRVIDQGTSASIAWTANPDVFDLAAGQLTFNQNLVGIGANGIAFQAGAGIPFGTRPLTITTGMGLLDRETGAVRYFAAGLDETVAVMSTGPDGALYIGNSPIRRLFTYCLNQLGFITAAVAPPVGGGAAGRRDSENTPRVATISFCATPPARPPIAPATRAGIAASASPRSRRIRFSSSNCSTNAAAPPPMRWRRPSSRVTKKNRSTGASPEPPSASRWDVSLRGGSVRCARSPSAPWRRRGGTGDPATTRQDRTAVATHAPERGARIDGPTPRPRGTDIVSAVRRRCRPPASVKHKRPIAEGRVDVIALSQALAAPVSPRRTDMRRGQGAGQSIGTSTNDADRPGSSSAEPVASATCFPSALRTSECATTIVRPACATVPRASSSRPSAIPGRRKFTLRSIDAIAVAAGVTVMMALASAASANIAMTPPSTFPEGGQSHSVAGNVKAAFPGEASTSRCPRR
jgi:hypothetical protein